MPSLAGQDSSRRITASGSALVAYFVFGPHRNSGIASEAVRAALLEVITSFRLVSIDAEIDTRNAPSIALIEKPGFVRTRLMPHSDEFKGAVSDEYHYSYVIADHHAA